MNSNQKQLSKSADLKARNQYGMNLAAAYSKDDYYKSRRFYCLSYSPSSINEAFRSTSKTGNCKLIISPEKPLTRPKSTMTYSYTKKAFYDSNGCLWIPRLFCDFSEDNPATLTSTTTHGKLTRDDVGASKQYSNDQFLKIQKSWIWKKPATAKNTQLLKKIHGEWSEWMQSPFLQKNKCRLSCESRQVIEKRKINHKCKTWLKSNLNF